jgi:hypothetical protein
MVGGRKGGARRRQTNARDAEVAGSRPGGDLFGGAVVKVSLEQPLRGVVTDAGGHVVKRGHLRANLGPGHRVDSKVCRTLADVD